MKQHPNQNSVIDIRVLRKKGMRKFIFVMVVFTIGMALLLFFEVGTWWIWYIYLAVWTLIEYRIAKNIELKWWHWILIICAILAIDWIVLELIDYIKS